MNRAVGVELMESSMGDRTFDDTLGVREVEQVHHECVLLGQRVHVELLAHAEELTALVEALELAVSSHGLYLRGCNRRKSTRSLRKSGR